MSGHISDVWLQWRPDMNLHCDICRLPVAPVTGGWAAIHDHPDVGRDWSAGEGHVHTVNGENH